MNATMTMLPLHNAGSMLEHVQNLRPLDDIVLPKDTQAVVARVLHENRRRGELEVLGLRSANRLLFCGPPGCGKTVTAGAIAHELGMPLASARLDAIMGQYMGETAAHLRQVFDAAKGGGMVLLLDEFDALGSKRSSDGSSAAGEMRRAVNSLLVMLEQVQPPSLVIAATNHHGVLDPAVWRRFDEVVMFPRPTLAQAGALLARLVGRYRPMDARVAPHWVRRLAGLSFAEVERVALDAVKARTLDPDAGFEDALAEALGRQKVRAAMSRAKP